MKSYKSFLRASVYFAVLVAAVWVISVSMFKEDIPSKTTANIENIQQLGIKEKSEGDQLNRDRKVTYQRISIEKNESESGETKNIGADKSVTILMYHYTTEKTENYMSVPKEKFREQMRYLKENAFNIITMDELYSHYIDSTPIPDNAVILTFDDGYLNNYLYAYPILKEFGFKGTIFMITSKIDQELYLTSKLIKELDGSGVMSVESHTVNHLELGKLPYDKQIHELKESKKAMEAILGREVKYISYPYGDFNMDTIKATSELKYKMGFGTIPGRSKKLCGIYTQNRIAVSGSFDIEHFKTLVNKK